MGAEGSARHRLGGSPWCLPSAAPCACAFQHRIDNTDLPAWTGKFFTGVPARPAPPRDHTDDRDHPVRLRLCRSPTVVGAVMIAVSLMMVSQVPTFSFKRIRVPHHNVLPACWWSAAGRLPRQHSWITLLAVGAAYIALSLEHQRLRQTERQRPTAVPDDIDTSATRRPSRPFDATARPASCSTRRCGGSSIRPLEVRRRPGMSEKAAESAHLSVIVIGQGVDVKNQADVLELQAVKAGSQVAALVDDVRDQPMHLRASPIGVNSSP